MHRVGEPLNFAAVERNNLSLIRAAGWHLGSWRKAVEEAGFNYSKLSLHQRWTKEQIIARIQQLHQQGAELNWRAVSLTVDPALAAAAIRPTAFGAWRAALTAAGLDPRKISRYQKWTPEEVVSQIQGMEKSGESLTSKGMQTRHQSLLCAARRRFGTWDAALEAAGYEPEEIRLRRRSPGRKKTVAQAD